VLISPVLRDRSHTDDPCGLAYNGGCDCGGNCGWDATGWDGNCTDTQFSWYFKDGCADGQRIYVMIFDRTLDNSPMDSIPSEIFDDNIYGFALRCMSGHQLCYGGWSEDVAHQWGAGKEGTWDCANCCYTCNGGEAPAKLLVCN